MLAPLAIATQWLVERLSEAQGGALEVQVYAGADGVFTLYEDDGTSLDYKSESKKDAAVRKRPPSSSSLFISGAFRPPVFNFWNFPLL